MKIIKGLICFVIVISAIMLPSSAAMALDYDYVNRHWDGTSVAYDDSALDPSWRLEVWEAKYTWSVAGSNFYFTQATGNSPYYLCIGEVSVPNAGAETQTSPMTFVPPDQFIIEDTCYTVFNEDQSWSVGGGGGSLDIETIALHEFGHWLRLEDLNDSSDSAKVMYKNYTGVKTSLTQGDINGIIAIYGED